MLELTRPKVGKKKLARRRKDQRSSEDPYRLRRMLVIFMGLLMILATIAWAFLFF